MVSLVLDLLIFAQFKIVFAIEKSTLYRYPTGDVSVADFKVNTFHYLWVEELASSMVADQFDCTFLCVGEPKCYSFNMAAYPDSKGLHLCELLATDKYRATDKFHANATFHHHSPSPSPCESAPCKNGADCVPEYERNSYHCDCKPGFCGTPCELGGNKTCSDIKLCNPKAPSGCYVIDPDGEGGVKPFKVYCDMINKDGVGVTVVSHDSETRTLVDGFGNPGTYSRDVTYTETDLVQLASLTASSALCEQFIKYECHGSVLLWNNGPMYGWWVSNDGEKMTYWGGVDSVPYKCACGLNHTCADTRYGCNCDKNDQEWREDSGLLTDKSKLPVIQLRFGDTYVPLDLRQAGYHTLGKFKCYGLN